VRDLLIELERAVTHAQYQPSSSTSESSDMSEDENDEKLTLPTETTTKSSPDNDSKLRCPHAGCPRNQGEPFSHKSSLNGHYTTRMGPFQYKTTRD